MDFSTKITLLLIFFGTGILGFGLFGLGVMQLLQQIAARLLVGFGAVIGIWATIATSLVIVCDLFPPRLSWEQAMHFAAMLIVIYFMIAIVCDPERVLSVKNTKGEGE